MPRQRTAQSHPHELHEVHEVTLGHEMFGYVGRFKGGRSWSMATATWHEGKFYPAWWPDKHASRSRAEHAAFARWLELHDLDKEGRFNAKHQSKIAEANARAAEAEDMAVTEALEVATPEDLLEAVVALGSRDLSTISQALLDHVIDYATLSNQQITDAFSESSLSVSELSPEVAEIEERNQDLELLLDEMRRVVFEPTLRERAIEDLRYSLMDRGIYH
jgi:hypothetical protein